MAVVTAELQLKSFLLFIQAHSAAKPLTELISFSPKFSSGHNEMWCSLEHVCHESQKK